VPSVAWRVRSVIVVLCGWWGRCHLDDHKARAAGVGTCEVDIGLIAGDVETLDGSTLLERRRGGSGKAEDGGDGEGRQLHVGDLL
jgi:hypothetical protein